MLGYRGIYSKDDKRPYRISRSKIDLFVQCPRCFWLETVKGIKRPSTPPFQINKAVDSLLKNEFDQYREKGEPHPLMIEYKITGVPYQHPKLNDWRENFVGVEYHDEANNLILFGAVDDLWIDSKTEQVIVVDYKATAKKKEVDLDAPWQIVYKRQMEIYQYLLRKIGLKVSDTGYFVYTNGIEDKDGFYDKVEFRTKVISYTGSDAWIDEVIAKLKNCLNQTEMPKNTDACEYCDYVYNRLQLTWAYMQKNKK